MDIEVMPLELKSGGVACYAETGALSAINWSEVHEIWLNHFKDGSLREHQTRNGSILGYFPPFSEMRFSSNKFDPVEFLHLDLEYINSKWKDLIDPFNALAEVVELLCESRNINTQVLDRNTAVLRISRYLGGNSSKHTDCNFFTVIPPASRLGLYLQDGSKEIYVPLDKTLIISGDLYAQYTNNIVSAVSHGVRGDVKDRISVTYFGNPRSKTFDSSGNDLSQHMRTKSRLIDVGE